MAESAWDVHAVVVGALQDSGTVADAIAAIKHALATIEDAPAHLRDAKHHELLATLGAPLVMTLGYPAKEVRELYQELQRASDPAYEVTAAKGLWVNAWTRGSLFEALSIAQKLLISSRDDRRGQVEGLATLGWSYAALGLWEAAKLACDRLIALCPLDLDVPANDPLTDHPLVLGLACRSMAHLQLGYPALAIADGEQAVAIAEALHHQFSIAVALIHLAGDYLWLHDMEAAKPILLRALAVCQQHGFDYWGTVTELMLDAVDAFIGKDPAASTAAMEQSVQRLMDTGAVSGLPMFHCLLAERHQALGNLEQARAWVERGMEIIEASEESSYRPELHRVRGELLMAMGDLPGGVAEISRAIRWCQERSLKLFELRATLSMARLIESKGQSGNMLPRVRELREWFDQGDRYPDLHAADQWLARYSLQ